MCSQIKFVSLKSEIYRNDLIGIKFEKYYFCGHSMVGIRILNCSLQTGSNNAHTLSQHNYFWVIR